MTIALTKEVEAFVTEQVRAGVCPDASTLINDVLRSLSEHRHRPFVATPELETWLLNSADSPTSPLTRADFDAIRDRVRARLDEPAASTSVRRMTSSTMSNCSISSMRSTRDGM